jgi:asparagine synthase (glutamine-hydrolysing)
MCGINGIVKSNSTSDDLVSTVKKMNEKIFYRGPDFTDVVLFSNVCLGHNRLSIIDLSKSANQPFLYKHLILVFNGEIYNYKYLRKLLIEYGYQFKSSSDTEVVLLAFDCWGTKAFDLFEGMFALSILDTKVNRLYLARDFFGEKPLYYFYREGSEIIFSSEINVVRDVVKSFANVKLDLSLIPHYLKYLYLPKDRSPYEQIFALSTGHYLEFDCENIQLIESKQYFTNPVIVDELNSGTLKSNLVQSIGDQLNSDVDLGLWLSGGIDSSLIAAIARQEFNIKLNTFSVRFNGLGNYNNEYQVASSVAKLFNHSINILDVNYTIDDDLIHRVIKKEENLIANPSAILHELLCEKTSGEGSKVILNGLGGDEFFGGYNRYRAFAFHKYFEYLNNSQLKFVIQFLSSNLSKSRNNYVGNMNRAFLKMVNSYNEDLALFYDNLISYKSDDSLRKFEGFSESCDKFNDLMRFDIENYMVNDLLYLSDKFSMSYSFELRSPFLSKKLFYNSFALNSSTRMGSPGSKHLLYSWLREYSSGKYKRQRKKGFSLSVEPYLKKFGNEKMVNLFKESELFDIVEEDYLINTIRDFYNGIDNSNNLYSLFYLANWRRINNE